MAADGSAGPPRGAADCRGDAGRSRQHLGCCASQGYCAEPALSLATAPALKGDVAVAEDGL